MVSEKLFAKDICGEKFSYELGKNGVEFIFPNGPVTTIVLREADNRLSKETLKMDNLIKFKFIGDGKSYSTVSAEIKKFLDIDDKGHKIRRDAQGNVVKGAQRKGQGGYRRANNSNPQGQTNGPTF